MRLSHNKKGAGLVRRLGNKKGKGEIYLILTQAMIALGAQHPLPLLQYDDNSSVGFVKSLIPLFTVFIPPS
jgi:hypothetical protein